MKISPASKSSFAFTILELLVATAVLALLLTLVLQVVSQTGTTVKQVTGKVDSFQAARAAFDVLNQTLSQATLNTYWGYDDASAPTKYQRISDLHFLIVNPAGTDPGIYFQAPLARAASAANEISGVLNACGFFVSFGSDQNFKPGHIPTEKERFRLMRAVQPAEDFAVFGSVGNAWMPALRAAGRPMADNIIALVAWPKLGKGADASGTAVSADFSYDSRSGSRVQLAQLPPIIQLTMIAIDETSAVRTPNLQATIDGILAARFVSVADFAKDIEEVGDDLTTANIAYQIFSSAVPLRESKWSK